jgi:F-type H+-transporting ATPase subunit b
MLLFSEHSPSGINLFIPQVSEIFWSGLVVVILAVLFCKFILPKLDSVLEQRKAEVEGRIDNAKKTMETAQKTLDSYNQQMKSANKEVAKIRETARNEAVQIVSDAKANATKSADQIMETATKTINAQKKQALVSLEQDIGQIATDLAQKLIGETLKDKDTQSKVIDNFIKSVDKNE